MDTIDGKIVIHVGMVCGSARLPEKKVAEYTSNPALAKTLFRGIEADLFIFGKESYKKFIDFWGLYLDDDDRETIADLFEE